MAAWITCGITVIDVVVFGGVFREVLDGDTAPRRRLGGSGVTAAILASAFGARTTLMSYVGEDDAAILALLHLYQRAQRLLEQDRA